MSFTRNVARDRRVLGELLQGLGLPISLCSPLIAHAAAVAAEADRLGLVSPGDRATVIRRHTADSLLFAVARVPAPGERWVDVGSGAGFPGLPLACCYPDSAFTLIEPNSRRAGFLELQAASLGLVNVDVVPRRFEQVEGLFDVAVSRAWRAPQMGLSSLTTLVRPGGEAIVAGANEQDPPARARICRLQGFGDVDSPGLLFMMSREG